MTINIEVSEEFKAWLAKTNMTLESYIEFQMAMTLESDEAMKLDT